MALVWMASLVFLSSAAAQGAPVSGEPASAAAVGPARGGPAEPGPGEPRVEPRAAAEPGPVLPREGSGATAGPAAALAAPVAPVSPARGGRPEAERVAPGARSLDSASRSRALWEQSLGNLALEEQEIERDRRGAQGEVAIAVGLYVGGAFLSLVGAGLLVGIVLDLACPPVALPCADTASYFAGFLPTAAVATVVLFGAVTAGDGAHSRHLELDRRTRQVEERRRSLEQRLRVAIGPGLLGLRVDF